MPTNRISHSLLLWASASRLFSLISKVSESTPYFPNIIYSLSISIFIVSEYEQSNQRWHILSILNVLVYECWPYLGFNWGLSSHPAEPLINAPVRPIWVSMRSLVGNSPCRKMYFHVCFSCEWLKSCSGV